MSEQILQRITENKKVSRQDISELISGCSKRSEAEAIIDQMFLLVDMDSIGYNMTNHEFISKIKDDLGSYKEWEDER